VWGGGGDRWAEQWRAGVCPFSPSRHTHSSAPARAHNPTKRTQTQQGASSAPDAAEPLARLSLVRLRLGQPLEAAQDALRAVEAGPRSAPAHAARGAALLALEEYEGALAAFGQADALLLKEEGQDEEEEGGGGGGCGCHHGGKPKKKQSSKASASAPSASAQLRLQVDMGLAKAREMVGGGGGGDGDGAAAAAAGPSAGTSAGTSAAAAAPATTTDPAAPSAPPAAAAAPPPPPPPPPPPAVRRQWYQTPDRVVVDVFVKGVPPQDALRATFEPRRLALRVDQAAGGPGAPAPPLPYTLELPLWGEVRPDSCSVEVLRSKLEVTLVKKQAGSAWPFLDAAGAEPAVGVAAASGGVVGAGAAATRPTSVAATVAAATTAPAPAAAPNYPSSRPRAAQKDWSAVEAEVKAMEEQGELDDGEDQLSAFFKKIFAGGDDDARRAMVKSYVESGGTVLSTNWREVGSKTVEPTPPEGMEAKKL
jgi:suppressor of G2 allele of SKP1